MKCPGENLSFNDVGPASRYRSRIAVLAQNKLYESPAPKPQCIRISFQLEAAKQVIQALQNIFQKFIFRAQKT